MIRIRHGSSREQAHAFFDMCRKQVKAAGLDPAETFFVFPFGGFGEFTYICSLLSEMRKEAKVALFLPENKIDFLEIFPKSADFLFDIRHNSHLLFLSFFFRECVNQGTHSCLLRISWAMGVSTLS